MSRQLFFTLITLSIVLITIARRKKYEIHILKSAIIGAIIVFEGILGAYLLGYFESGNFGPISYYGSVFLVPIAMIGVSKAFKLPYNRFMDYCAPSVALAAAIGKIYCASCGCCAGIVLYVNDLNESVVFPSQIVEMTCAFIIVAILLVLEQKNAYNGNRYGLFLIIYGAVRFILNWFRDTNAPIFNILPIGCLWSIVSITAGILWISMNKRKNKEC